MLAVIITAGLLVLIAAGAWQLSTARLEGVGTDVKRTQLVSEEATVFSTADLQSPGRITADREKLRNAVTIALEVAIVVAGLLTVAFVVSRPTVPVHFKAVAVGALVVGAALIGRALYVRLGLYHPALETVLDYERSLSKAVDEALAEDFAGLHGAMTSARGEGVDEVTVGVLAAAKNGGQLEEVAEWGESVGIADREEFQARADRLAEADLIEYDGDRLDVADHLAGADEDQIATVAASVLN